jgi:hypothetical protein
MYRNRFFKLAAIGVFGTAVLMAHHSFSAEFDDQKSVTLVGTVTKLEWTNPHVWVYIDVKDEKGDLQHWQCESGPPNMLARAGWRKTSLKPGDSVTINGYRAKDGTNTISAHDIILPDGRKVLSGSAEDVGTRK